MQQKIKRCEQPEKQKRKDEKGGLPAQVKIKLALASFFEQFLTLTGYHFGESPWI